MAQVFVSHAAKDLDAAFQICEWLRADRHTVFLARDLEEGLRVGDALRDRLHEEISRADAMVCLVSTAFADSPWCAAEVALAGWSGIRILPVRVEGDARHELVPADTVYADLAADAERARGELVQAVRRLDTADGASWSAGRSPFPGLRAFDAGLARVFFGRAAETRRLAERLRAPSISAGSGLLAVVGPSGCGKSSLVGAGLVPLLAADRDWLVLPTLLPGVDPVGALARQIAIAGRQRDLGWSTEQATAMLGRPGGLAELATELLAAAAPARWVLLVVDQAEELITRAADSGRHQFAAIIGEATAGPVRATATLRSEYLDPLLRLAAETGLQVGTFPLAPLARDMLRTVITGPAGRAGITVDDELVARLVDDTGSGEALPLLAFVLDRLAVGVDRGGVLSPIRYDEMGAVQGALAAQADAALVAACAATGRNRDDVLSGLLRLVTVDDTGQATRQRTSLAALPETVRTELDEFVGRRLLVVDTDNDGDPVVTVAHEKVLIAWPPLANAMTHATDDLRLRRTVEDAATDWDNRGRPVDHLWEAGRVANAEQTLDASDLSPTAVTFLATGRRHGRRRRRRATAVLGVLLLLVSTGALLSLTQWRSAEQTRLEAIAEGLVARADALRETDPRLSFRLGIAADEIASTSRTRSSLLESLTGSPLLANLAGHPESVSSVAYSPNRTTLATGGYDGTVILWDVTNPATPHRIGTLLKDRGNPGHSSMAFAPNGTTLATANSDGTVNLWDLTDPAIPKRIGTPPQNRDNRSQNQGAPVHSVVFAPNGTTLATASDGTVNLWDLTNAAAPQRIGTPLTHENTVASVAFTPDGTTLATGTGGLLAGGAVYLWNLTNPATPRPVTTPLPHDKPVTSVAFTPDGKSLATGTGGLLAAGAVHIWNLTNPATPRPIGTPLGHDSPVTSVVFAPDGRTLATGGRDSTVILWDLTHRPDTILRDHDSPVISLAFDANGTTLATASYDGTVIRWDPTHPDISDPIGATLRDQDSPVYSVAFTPDGTTLTAATSDGTVDLWNFTAPDSPHRTNIPLQGQASHVYSAAFAPDGTTLVTTTGDGSAILWDLTNPGTSGPTRIPLGHGSSKYSLAFNADGTVLATGSRDGIVTLWNIATAAPHLLSTLPWDQESPVTALAFAPNGRTLATGSHDGTVILWDITTPATPRPIGNPLQDRDNPVTALAFAPDSTFLATANTDGTAILWDIRNPGTPDRTGTPLGHDSPVYSVAFTPDGRTLATGSGDFLTDGTVILWDLDELAALEADPATAACQRVGQGLAEDEWTRYIPSLPYRDTCPR